MKLAGIFKDNEFKMNKSLKPDIRLIKYSKRKETKLTMDELYGCMCATD